MLPFRRCRRALTLFLALVLSALALPAAADSISDYHHLFGALDEGIADARKAHVDVISPENFDKVMKYHKDAEAKFRARRGLDDVREDVKKSRAWLARANEVANVGKVVFGEAVQARLAAKSADAPQYARELWDKAEETMRDAARRLEKDDIRDAKEGARRATDAYTQAELVAIKTNYLSRARSLYKEADEVGADKYAIKTYVDAKLLLEQAERELTQNRYDIDYPRDLARRARNESQHAINITKSAIAVKKKDIAVEDIILDYEAPLIAISESMDIVPSLHEGYEPTRDAIIAKVQGLQKDSQALEQLRLINAEQAAEIARLSEKLGIYNEQLAAEERYRELLAQLEGIFTPQEAEIFRQGKNMIIRMVGLNFASGKSDLSIDHMKLLAKVKYAIQLSKTEMTTIEGHTDSFGGDESNQKLSEDRANSVVGYLKEDSSLRNASMIAVGYGETRPIANNETAPGREKNRRIDVVIKLDKAKVTGQ